MAKIRPEPRWWRELCAGFLRNLGRRGRRPNTQRTYQYELTDFGAWLHCHHVRLLSDLTRHHLEAWQDELQGRSAASTQQVAAAAVKGALKWAANQELGLSSPTLWLCIATPRAPRLVPHPIPRSNLMIILGAFAAPGWPTSLTRLRSRALFLLILSSGARISEAVSLERGQLQDRMATVTVKGGGEHLLVISPAAEVAINEYLQARQDQSPLLFISHSSRREGLAIDRCEAQRNWNQLCRELRIPRFRNHMIRHTCATELLRRHVDSLTIARHLGHRGLGSISGYAEVALESRREAMQALDSRVGE